MDGILLVDKPTGMTSHDVVFKIRKLLNVPKIGHAGTLDPLASGLLVVFIGRATKLVSYFMDHDKTYDAEITFGRATDTEDAGGATIAEKACDGLDPEAVDAALKSCVGKFNQIPPAYSAIKIDGRKLYQYARSNQPLPTIAPRPIEIFAFDRTSAIVAADGLCRFRFVAKVSKGTYVRAICRDLGVALGYPAHMSALRRIEAGSFDIASAVTLAQIEAGAFHLHDPLDFLDFPRVRLSDDQVIKAINGAFLPLAAFQRHAEAVVTDGAGTPLAIYVRDPDKKIMRLAVML